MERKSVAASWTSYAPSARAALIAGPLILSYSETWVGADTGAGDGSGDVTINAFGVDSRDGTGASTGSGAGAGAGGGAGKHLSFHEGDILHVPFLTHCLRENIECSWPLLQILRAVTWLACRAFYKQGWCIALIVPHQQIYEFFLYHLYAKHDFNGFAYLEMYDMHCSF